MPQTLRLRILIQNYNSLFNKPVYAAIRTDGNENFRCTNDNQ